MEMCQAQLTDDAEKIVFRQLFLHAARLESDSTIGVEVDVAERPRDSQKSAVCVNDV